MSHVTGGGGKTCKLVVLGVILIIQYRLKENACQMYQKSKINSATWIFPPGIGQANLHIHRFPLTKDSYEILIISHTRIHTSASSTS